MGSAVIYRIGNLRVWALSLLLLSGFAAAAHAQDRHALVVGINAYENLGSLEKAVNDGRAMAESLERAGFTVDAGFDLTRRDFVLLLTQFLNRLEPDDEALVFYAGHAVAIDNDNFLVPADASALEQSSEALIIAESIGQEFLLEQITATGVRLTVVIMDACRNNPFEGLTTRSLGRDAGLAITQPPRGVFMMYSADEGQTALDRLSNDDPHPNSVFTRTLLPLIEEPGIDIVDIARRLRGDVQALAASVQHQQFPVYRDRMQGEGRFIVRPAAAVIEQPEVVTADPVAATETPCDAARADWALLGEAPSSFLLETFISIHADCPLLAAMATQQLAALEAPAEISAAWEMAYALDIPQEVSLTSVLPSPCPPASVHDCVIWGVTEGVSGQAQTSAWLGGSDFSSRHRPGTHIPLSGGTGVVPLEVAAAPNAAYGALPYVLRTAEDYYTSNITFHADNLSSIVPVEMMPDMAQGREIFGVFGMAYSPHHSMWATSEFGVVTLWRHVTEVTSSVIRGGRPGLQLFGVCRFTADGVVPWSTLAFSDDGSLLVGRHGGWTVVMELPDFAPSAQIDPINYCEDLGVRSSNIHYFPFQDMTRDGRFIAVTDISTAGVYTYDVVSIYDPRRFLENREVRYNEPVPRDRVETELGGIVNLFGHESEVTQVTFSPSGDSLISITEGGVLRFWSIPSGELLATHETLNGAGIERADFTGQGTCLLVDLRSGPSLFIDPGTGEILHEFRQPSTRYAYSQEGEQLVVYSPGERAARVYSPPAHNCGVP